MLKDLALERGVVSPADKLSENLFSPPSNVFGMMLTARFDTCRYDYQKLQIIALIAVLHSSFPSSW
jgi:hypothetical protein